MNINQGGVLLEELRSKHSFDLNIVDQLDKEFGDDYYDLVEEYNEFWDNGYFEQLKTQSSGGAGHIAGAGPVDYNEGKVIYLFIRTKRPKNVMEIGFASGCSSSIIAKALEMNGEGKLYTVDLKENPGMSANPTQDQDKVWRIDYFNEYIDKGIIIPTYPKDAIDYLNEFDTNIPIDLVFTDGGHEPEFCYPVATKLRELYPQALHLYHEWSFSPLTLSKAKGYISIGANLNHQKFAEREAYERTFSYKDYEHYGFYGSCGLGVVKPRKQPGSGAIKVYYRLSNFEAGMSKKKIPNATKQHCLENCIDVFGKENITVIGDTLNEETKKFVIKKGLKLVEVENGTGSGTFRDALDLAIQENNSGEMVYLLEDDFLHLPPSARLLEEGITRAPLYTTLYDHPDKYINKDQGGNPQIEQRGEVTRLIKTDSVHWKLTNSTVMSFACRVERLIEDHDLLMKYSSNNITDSYGLFTELSQTKQIGVLSSVPGYSTHCEAAWLSPLTNWNVI